MGFPRFCARLSGTHNGTQSQLFVHVFMNGGGTVAVSLPLQINRHAAVTVNAVVPVVNSIYPFLNLCFLCIVICLPVLPVVIVSIWADPQPPEQPANAEFPIILVNESISL